MSTHNLDMPPPYTQTHSPPILTKCAPFLFAGGGGVWPLPGGERDHQSGFLPQRRPGAASSAAPKRQHVGFGRSGETS